MVQLVKLHLIETLGYGDFAQATPILYSIFAACNFNNDTIIAELVLLIRESYAIVALWKIPK